MTDKERMMPLFWALYLILIAIAFGVGIAYATAGTMDDPRCCIEPERLPDGTIKRRADVLTAFKRVHPCPSTGATSGACAGWAIDHVIPLACGGRDEVGNLQWLPHQIKSAAGKWPKDRWERKIYCQPLEVVK